MKKPNLSHLKKPLIWKIGIPVVVCLGLIYVLFRKPFHIYVINPSPEEIAGNAVAALEKKDIYALLKLTLDEEKQILNLNLSNTGLFLKETLYKEGNVSFGAIEKDYAFVSRRRFQVPIKNSKMKLTITVVDTPKDGWKVALSETLFSAVLLRSKEYPIPRNGYGTLIHRYNINGFRTAEGMHRGKEFFPSDSASL